MMIKKISLFLLTASVLFCQEKLTLDKAIELGLQNNYSIRIAKNEAAIESNNFTLGNAGFLPKLDVTATISKTKANTKQEYSDGRSVNRSNAETDSKNAGVALNWTLFDGFNMFVSYSKLKQFKETGEINAKIEIEDNVALIIQNYYNIVSLQEGIKAQKDAIEISEERVKIADDKLKLGSASRLELLQAKVDLNADSSNLLKQQINLSNAKVNLNELLGRNTNIDFIIQDSISNSSNFSYDELKERILAKNNELRIAEKNMEIARLNLSGIRSQIYPQLGAYINYNFSRLDYQAGLYKLNQNQGFSYGLSLSLNLFNGLNTDRQIENAHIDIMNSELEFNSTKNAVEADFEHEYLNYKNGLTLVKLEEENLEVAKQNAEIAMERFRNGSYSPLELREAQKALLDSKTRLVSAQYSAKFAEIELLRLSGQIIR
ncbi:MAG: TolC family protein [Ignavibacteriales bacterium]|nr:MAG: TolC family protein [Ignavibacteriales bacterium]